MKNFKWLARTVIAASAFLSSSAFAGLIVAEYDLLYADVTTQISGTEMAATTVANGFTASSLKLTNTDNTDAAFGNHFYHNGWDTTKNLAKYYEVTLSNTDDFSLENVSFSLENLQGSSQFWLATSLDGYATDIATGLFSNGEISDFSIDLNSLGMIDAPISFRWYMTNDGVNQIDRAGFANHQCSALPLFSAGCGDAAVGLDLTFTTASIPEPGSLALFLLGLFGFSLRKIKS